ncbi:MAG: hypothetical protein AB7F89_18160, partial [Pirellulaceae bacterium]
MSRRNRMLMVTGLMMSCPPIWAASLGTGFTYQGHLRQNGEPYTGPVSLTFTLWDAESGGTQVGGPSTTSAEAANGLFTATVNGLNEFGEGAFSGDERFLEITINGETLPMRQRIAPAPHALFAPGGGGGDSIWELSGTDAFYTEGDVGIGVVDPARRLHVRGNNGVIRIDRDVDQTSLTLVRTAPGNFDSVWKTYNVGVLSTALGNGALQISDFGTNVAGPGTPRLTIASGGNVGIGTTTPGQRLSVDGMIESLGASGGFKFPDGTVQITAAIGGGGGDSVWSLNGADAYYAAGYVGIGTNLPSAPLEVVGSAKASSFSVANPNNAAATVNLNWLNDVARIRVGGSGTGAQNGFSIQSTGDEVLLRVTDNPTEVGIATDNPMAKLHVKESTTGLQAGALENDDIIVEAQDAAVGLYSTSQGAWGSAIALKEVTSGETPGQIVDTWGIARQTSTDGSKLHFTYGPSDNYATNPATMVFDADGHVGIGTATPERELDIKGSVLVDGAGNVPLILTDNSVYGAGLVMGDCFNCPSAN